MTAFVASDIGEGIDNMERAQSGDPMKGSEQLYKIVSGLIGQKFNFGDSLLAALWLERTNSSASGKSSCMGSR